MKENGIIVLKHAVNQGKGRALKTAFNFVLNEMNELDGVFIADANGQHLVSDIKQCAEEIVIDEGSLIMRCRIFDDSEVPFKSRFGSKITSSIFPLYIGINITDSMTGLRGLNLDLVRLFMKTDEDRFHYENNILIDAMLNDIPLIEIPNETVY